MQMASGRAVSKVEPLYFVSDGSKIEQPRTFVGVKDDCRLEAMENKWTFDLAEIEVKLSFGLYASFPLQL